MSHQFFDIIKEKQKRIVFLLTYVLMFGISEFVVMVIVEKIDYELQHILNRAYFCLQLSSFPECQVQLIKHESLY